MGIINCEFWETWNGNWWIEDRVRESVTSEVEVPSENCSMGKVVSMAKWKWQWKMLRMLRKGVMRGYRRDDKEWVWVSLEGVLIRLLKVNQFRRTGGLMWLFRCIKAKGRGQNVRNIDWLKVCLEKQLCEGVPGGLKYAERMRDDLWWAWAIHTMNESGLPFQTLWW